MLEASSVVSSTTIQGNCAETVWTRSSNDTLYAQFTPSIYTIILNNVGATTDGTTEIYEKYDEGYFLNSNATELMMPGVNEIAIPVKKGYKFMGYYTGTDGSGTKYIDEHGYLTSNADPAHFTSNGTLYAYWSRGALNIKEEVSGAEANVNKEFTFTINVKDNGVGISNTYAYTGSKSGNLTFNNGIAIFTLKHNQSIDIYFPTGYTYTITQDRDGYVLTKTNDTGTIGGNGNTIKATFTDTLGEVIPTGIFDKIFPYLLLVLFVVPVLVIITIMYKKKRNIKDET